MDLVEGLEMGSAFSLSSPALSSAFSLGLEAQSEGPMLQLSSSKEVDVFSFKTGEIEDLPSHSPVYEELVEVVTQTVAKLSIDTHPKK